MELSELLVIAVSFAFAMSISWFLIAPFFCKEQSFIGEDGDIVQRETLLRRKEMLLESLEDLELEWRNKTMDEEHYQRSKAELQQRASECLAAIDAVNVGQQGDMNSANMEASSEESNEEPNSAKGSKDERNGTSQAA